MPSNLVKTPRDEHLWSKAKQRAKEEGRTDDYAYINGIYQRMKGNRSAAEEPVRVFEVPYRRAPVVVGEPSPKAPPRDEFPFVGCINFQGLIVDLENLAGSFREGKEKSGHPWKVPMHYHYGEFRGSMGTDDDPLDVYVGDNAYSPLAVVIHQAVPDTGEYDEDKVMVGFDDVDSAVGAYQKQYDRPGFYRQGWHRAMPLAALAAWMYDPEKHGKPVTASRRLAAGDARVAARLAELHMRDQIRAAAMGLWP